MINKILSTSIFLFLVSGSILSQNVGINETGAIPDASAALDVSSTTRGMLVPRMTQAQRDAITSPATGLLIYQTNSTPGFYYYTGSAWTGIGGADADWQVGAGTVYNLSDRVGIGMTPPLLGGGELNVGGSGAFISSFLEVDGLTETKRLTVRDVPAVFGSDTLCKIIFNGAGSSTVGMHIENSNAGPALNVFSNDLIAGDVAIRAQGSTGIHATGTIIALKAVADTAVYAQGTTALYAKGNVRMSPAAASADFFVSNIGIEPSMLPSTNNYGYVGSNANRIYQGHFTNLTVYGTFTNLSDRSIKENIVPLNGSLSKILQLSGKRYDLKSKFMGLNTTSDGKKRSELEQQRKNKLGFIAQELETVFPELVHYNEESGLKSVDYIGVIPVLVEAVKEQQAIIDSLKEKVKESEDLKQRVERLEELLVNTTK